MLKLKYLFDNRSLALMLLQYWEFDADSLDMLNYFRISSNAIYPFRWNGRVRFLRFAPAEEKLEGNITAELEFLQYLNKNGYSALKPVSPISSGEWITAWTPWGKYFAAVFEQVSGKQIGELEYKDSIMKEYGRALGRLHRLSACYKPETRRWSYEDVLNWIREILSDYPNQEKAFREVDLLQNFLSGLPKTGDVFGLIHYDFEPDNVFYDELTGVCSAIDFDDAMYHWFAMDIEQALDSIENDMNPIRYDDAKTCFLLGYRSEYPVSDEMLSILPVFRRFADLYGYARILVATAESWQKEPEWMVDLRGKLARMMETRSGNFGNPLE